MNLLLDTHVYLWWLVDDPRIGACARESIAEPRWQVHVSAATVWEIAIKSALGRLTLDGTEAVSELEPNAFLELPIRAEHAARAGALPAIHSDPFDRMLIAQAQSERLTLVTADRRFIEYDVAVLNPTAN